MLGLIAMEALGPLAAPCVSLGGGLCLPDDSYRADIAICSISAQRSPRKANWAMPRPCSSRLALAFLYRR